MSLTRNEWEEMWESVSKLENMIKGLYPHIGIKKRALVEIRKIKQQIQSVIGQME